MKKPLIFSGTTEGRLMSERLSAAGIDHIVCVATGYGELVMDKNLHADVRQGRLDVPEMERLISEEACAVFDATHPYASVVSENIRGACSAAGAEYVRILRSECGSCGGEDVKVFADVASCAEDLRKTEGNILLTTGSKEVGIYAEDPGVRERLFVRVLPSEESIRLCNEAGITGRNIIAMQGPFSREMDLAVIRQYDIRILVTKSSGRTGGFEEKIEAAREAGISAYVIGRPAEETGISVSDALQEYFGIAPFIRADLVATGPGRSSLMTDEAAEAVRKADIIFGAPRMIASYSDAETYPYYLARDIIPVIEKKRPERIAVLFSGDTGYCSGAAKMKPELEKWLTDNGYDHEIVIHPGVSSFAYLASKTGIPYTGAGLCSMHGRSGDPDNIAEITDTIRNKDHTFLLLSGAEDVKLLGRMLIEKGLGGCSVILGRDLSYPEEEIRELKPDECEGITEKGLYIALIKNPEASHYHDEENAGSGSKRLVPVIRDDEFIRGKVPMTKENIRHLSVLRLDLDSDSVVYDVGSGTGSVACEIASLSSEIRVYAIEMKDEACELIRQNADKFTLNNIQLVKGRAPEALEGLPAPTHAFIGGSSGDLRQILETLSGKAGKDGIRVVVNAVSLETIAEINSVIRETGARDVLIEQIAVSRSRELGSYHLMTAENPVMIASFTIGGRI